jgi:hypothetical protein
MCGCVGIEMGTDETFRELSGGLFTMDEEASDMVVKK